MFKCQKCEKSDHKPHRVVVERKEVDHLKGAGTGPRGGRGTQIAREVTVCAECLSSTPEAYKPEPVEVVQTKTMTTSVEDLAS